MLKIVLGLGPNINYRKSFSGFTGRVGVVKFFGLSRIKEPWSVSSVQMKKTNAKKQKVCFHCVLNVCG
jgi:hypothetical protein